MKKLLLILHMKAADDPELREAVRALRERGHEVEVRVTWEEGDAESFAAEGVRGRFDTLLAGGGDGTVHEVVNGMSAGGKWSGESPSLGVLPMGTGNDFATAAEVPMDCREALELVVNGTAQRIDLARCGDRVFLNMATSGFGAEVSSETSEELKGLLGSAAYFLTGLTRMGDLEATSVRVTGEGFEWSGAVAGIAVGNGKLAGGGTMLCPDARIDDGLLNLRILPFSALTALGETLQAILAEGASALEKEIVSRALPSVRIESDEAFQMNFDGEASFSGDFEIEVLPSSLSLHLPEESPLLGS